MNQNKKILVEYKKFLKLAHNINSYNIRIHTLRKLRYDFQNYLKNNSNEEIFTKFKQDYDRLNRIVLVQNINVPYEDFSFNRADLNKE